MIEPRLIDLMTEWISIQNASSYINSYASHNWVSKIGFPNYKKMFSKIFIFQKCNRTKSGLYFFLSLLCTFKLVARLIITVGIIYVVLSVGNRYGLPFHPRKQKRNFNNWLLQSWNYVNFPSSIAFESVTW